VTTVIGDGDLYYFKQGAWRSLKPFNPLSLSPALWFDAADSRTIIASSGDVSQWNDKSGFGRNVTQGTGASQPKTGTTTLNGLNVIAFDGSNDTLRSAAGAASFGIVECYIVARTQSTGRVIIGVPHAATHTSPFFRWVLFHNVTDILQTRIDGVAANSAANAINTSVAQLYRIETGEGDAYVNLTRVINSAGATVTYPNSTPLSIGSHATGGEVLNGFVAEILIFDRALTANEKAGINNYLSEKWGVF
jgi:hypothetical protein